MQHIDVKEKDFRLENGHRWQVLEISGKLTFLASPVSRLPQSV
jgi:hypothetical protein